MSHMHLLSDDGALVACSEAVDMMHHYDDRPSGFTGLGFCPHTESDDNPLGQVVEVPFPVLTLGIHRLFVDFTL